MDKEQLLNRLMARCSRAEYSTGQVASYARRWLDKETAGDTVVAGAAETAGGAVAVGKSKEMVVAEIVERLVREKFVDDRRFAAAFVR
ncbi:MAG: RecX family transcriptional regulator, partial [Bacteroidales bacterium]|nr:RecX family transcriptional regulator [Bacteroidales bacterium]